MLAAHPKACNISIELIALGNELDVHDFGKEPDFLISRRRVPFHFFQLSDPFHLLQLTEQLFRLGSQDQLDAALFDVVDGGGEIILGESDDPRDEQKWIRSALFKQSTELLINARVA